MAKSEEYWSAKRKRRLTRQPSQRTYQAAIHTSMGYQPAMWIHDPSVTSRTTTKLVGSKFLLATEQGDVLMDAGNIRDLTIENMNTELPHKETKTTKRKRLQFQFESANEDVEILLMYFRPGVRWIPTYRVDLAEDDVEDDAANKEGEVPEKLARLDLQAEIVNEAEDLIDMPIDIVVGVPNFRFKSVPSPLVLEKHMRNALLQAAPVLMGQGGFRNNMMSNALFTQRSGEQVGGGGGEGDGEGQAELPEELTAEGGNDLFVYHPSENESQTRRESQRSRSYCRRTLPRYSHLGHPRKTLRLPGANQRLSAPAFQERSLAANRNRKYIEVSAHHGRGHVGRWISAFGPGTVDLHFPWTNLSNSSYRRSRHPRNGQRR